MLVAETVLTPADVPVDDPVPRDTEEVAPDVTTTWPGPAMAVLDVMLNGMEPTLACGALLTLAVVNEAG